uniref:(northern house mosquito) hypothetical protein n=1 Tax=Culex pipiens TaxID=7175 RepID=A0A8D8FSD4_CULPI
MRYHNRCTANTNMLHLECCSSQMGTHSRYTKLAKKNARNLWVPKWEQKKISRNIISNQCLIVINQQITNQPDTRADNILQRRFECFITSPNPISQSVKRNQNVCLCN